jgi:hypothetical protein
MITQQIILEMNDGDIYRAIKNPKYTPLHYLISRSFKEIIDNIDLSNNGVLIWNDEVNDYNNYRYSNQDNEVVDLFLQAWNRFIDDNLDDFSEPNITISLEKVK